MRKDIKKTLRVRGKIYTDFGYIPWQPGFECFGRQYENRVISRDSRYSGIIADYYEISEGNFCENTIVTIPDGCTDFMFAADGQKLYGYISTGVKERKNFCFGDIQYLFGVRFMPGNTHQIFRDSIKEMVHNPINLTDVLPDISEWTEKIVECKNFGERVKLVSEYITEKLLEEDTVSRILQFCVERIYRYRGNIGIDSLAEETGYSTRYLGTLFNNYIGMSPKEFCQTVRMQYALFLSRKSPEMKMETIADLSGYADLSHMNREFRKYMNCKISDFRMESVKKNQEKSRNIIFAK